MNVIEIKNLTKNYETFTLDHVNLVVPGGTIMGLIGENGAGKSTTLKALIGLIQYEGECRILGQPVHHALMEQVGVVLDESTFHDAMNPTQIGEMLRLIYQQWDAALYRQYLQRFQLPPKQKIKEFSRGMKMKLAIAAALSHHPKVLVLDEATGGLDPVVRNEILEEFRNFVTDEEHGILISSHITSDLEHLADYVTYIHNGAIYISGEKDELLNRYAVVQCSEATLATVDANQLIGAHRGAFGSKALVKDRTAFSRCYPELLLEPVSLEDIMLFIAKGERI